MHRKQRHLSFFRHYWLLLSDEERNGVRVEVYEYSDESSMKVSFRSLQKLYEWLKLRFRKQLLKGNDTPSSKILDMLSEVHGYVVMN